VRIVFDPGVLIAALLSAKGAPAGLLIAWRRGAFDLVLSPKLLAELGRVLARPKLRRYLSEEDAESYVVLLKRAGVLVEDPPEPPPLTPDPGDDDLVALARAAGARYLISGDRHLTGLQDADPPVLTPRQMLSMLEE
jgi:uncharacterized protein